MKDSLKGWGINMRGDSIKKKKELALELDMLEVLEEQCTLIDEQRVRKGEI